MRRVSGVARCCSAPQQGATARVLAVASRPPAPWCSRPAAGPGYGGPPSAAGCVAARGRGSEFRVFSWGLTMHVDVAVAGAGPAGLACARTLLNEQPGLRVLLLEAGRAYRRRPCPVDCGFHCTGCAGVCNVISGFGGSMHYGDGAKLSQLPSGRRLTDHLGGLRADELCQQAYGWLTGALTVPPVLVGQAVSPGAVAAFAADGLALREYPVAVLSESGLRTVIESLHTELDGRAILWHGSELTGAELDRAGMRLTVRNVAGVRQVTAGRLVLATGRRGVTATTRLLDTLGIPSQPPDMSVGIRLEMPAPLLAAIGAEHPDVKVTQHLDGRQKVKTFCFCGGPNGGRIKFTHYHDAFGPGGPVITLDGHETLERHQPDGHRHLAANFGLLCQATGRGTPAAALGSFLTGYRELSGGRPLVQSLRAFLTRTDTPASWEEIRTRLSFDPSVADLVAGRVDRLFADAEHAALATGFRRLMDSILRHSGTLLPDSGLDDILVIGPELESLWATPPLDDGFQVPRGLPLHVTGDAAGIAQGIVQAAMTGIAAANAITRTHTLAGATR
ncbi:hypothetical protein [Streptomyces clavuligerus]|uniref:DNA polymerase beta domain protein region n=2 Tax=Streptomyces clavuligerus TaxID=1901 RepID=D5SJ79_STRCL|nr:DNA polymerase beta domain protein region [Streptomyces clavuligerus]